MIPRNTGTFADFQQAHCRLHRPPDSSRMLLLPSTRCRKEGSGFCVCRCERLRIIACFAKTVSADVVNTQAGYPVDETVKADILGDAEVLEGSAAARVCPADSMVSSSRTWKGPADGFCHLDETESKN